MVKLIEPQSYCMGVKRAIKLLNNALKADLEKPYYLVGKLIHNDLVMEEYLNQGVIIIDEHHKADIKNISKGTLIFQAHGTDESLISDVKARGLTVVDATCPVVSLIHNKIKEYLKQGYEIIYVGKNNHSESEAVLTIDNNIHFVAAIDDINKLNINNDKIYITNQTTLSTLDLKNIYDCIKNKYPYAIIDNKICLATTKRQIAVLNSDYDLVIVVGDIHSSNTKRLYELALSKTNSILISNLADLMKYDLTKYQNIGITSGASTPMSLVMNIYNYLIK